MADNITTPVPASTVLATKEIGGRHHPKSIITDEAGADAVGAVGAAPAANTILGRLKAIADALLGTIGVSVSALPLPAGAATSAKQDAIITAIGGAQYYPAIQPVSGTVAVTGTFWQATQPVSLASAPLPTGAATDATLSALSGKLPASPGIKTGANSLSIVPASDAVFAVSAASLPLPTGAATAAKQDSIIAALGGTLAVAASSLPLPTGAATAAKQDASTAAIEATALVDAPFPITPHATNALSRQIKAIAIVTGGTVVFRAPGASTDETVTLPAGLFPMPATHIRATSTAEGLTGF